MDILGKKIDDYKCLLFDLDGTLINSMVWHNIAWTEAFKEAGLEIPQSLLDETMGMASVRIVEIANKRYNTNLDAKKVAANKRAKYLDNLSKVETVPKLMEIVKKYHGIKPLGIITGGSHAVVDKLLPLLKIDYYFDSIVCADDTTLGKDSTQPYEMATEQLKVDMKDCIFFDDGDVGLKGARLSGMDVVHVDINSPDVFISINK